MRLADRFMALPRANPAADPRMFRCIALCFLTLLAAVWIVLGTMATASVTVTESSFLSNDTQEPDPTMEGTPVSFPEIEFATLDGLNRSLSHWQGNLIVLNFWATWCPPCIREMPLFQEYHERFSHQGLAIVTIAIDHPDAVREFVSRLGLRFPVLLGLEDGMEVADAFGNSLGALPFTVVIDRQSEVREQRLGEVHAKDLDDWVNRYLQSD